MCGEESAFALSCTTSRVNDIEVVRVHPKKVFSFTPSLPVMQDQAGLSDECSVREGTEATQKQVSTLHEFSSQNPSIHTLTVGSYSWGGHIF